MDFTSSGRYYHRHSLEQRLRLAHDRWHIRMATLYLAAIFRARRSSLRSSPGQTDGSANRRFAAYAIFLSDYMWSRPRWTGGATLIYTPRRHIPGQLTHWFCHLSVPRFEPHLRVTSRTGLSRSLNITLRVHFLYTWIMNVDLQYVMYRCTNYPVILVFRSLRDPMRRASGFEGRPNELISNPFAACSSV